MAPNARQGKGTSQKPGPKACVLDASLITQYLTDPHLESILPHRGLRLKHAHIVGDIDLAETDILPQVWIDDSMVEGDVDLTDAHLHRLVSMDGSSITGNVRAERVASELSIFMRNRALVFGDVDLSGADIHGDVSFFSSTIGGKFSASDAHFFVDVFLNDIVSDKRVQGDSRIEGGIEMIAATIDGRLDLSRQYVGTPRHTANLMLDDINIKGTVFATGMHVFGNTSFNGARTGGNLILKAAKFDGALDASALFVGDTLYLDFAEMKEKADFTDAHILYGMMIRRATLFELNLTNAETEELTLGGTNWRSSPQNASATASPVSTSSAVIPGPRQWSLDTDFIDTDVCAKRTDQISMGPSLQLRNAHIGAIEETTTSWPPVLGLHGFRYERLGAFINWLDKPVHNTAAEWKNWINRDPDFTPQPYVQLASVLQIEGLREMSEDILFASRERERRDVGCKLWT